MARGLRRLRRVRRTGVRWLRKGATLLVVLAILTLDTSLASAAGPQPANVSVAVNPATAGTHGAAWTVKLSLPYCGGYQIGGYVQLAPQWSGAVPASVPAASVTFAGGPATVSVVNGTLRVGPGPGRMWAQYCTSTPSQFEIDIAASAGLANPATAGSYSVLISTGSNPSPVTATLQIAASSDGSSGGSAGGSSSSSRTVTLADNGSTISLGVGERFLLDLGIGYNSQVTVGDTNVVARVPNVMVIQGAQGLYEGKIPGQTTLQATGTPSCYPRCLMASRFFSITVVVHP